MRIPTLKDWQIPSAREMRLRRKVASCLRPIADETVPPQYLLLVAADVLRVLNASKRQRPSKKAEGV